MNWLRLASIKPSQPCATGHENNQGDPHMTSRYLTVAQTAKELQS